LIDSNNLEETERQTDGSQPVLMSPLP